MALKQEDRLGVKQAIDEINSLRQEKSYFTSGAVLLLSPFLLRWEDNHFVMDFTTTDNVALNAAHYQSMKPFTLTNSGKESEVPEKGAIWQSGINTLLTLMW